MRFGDLAGVEESARHLPAAPADLSPEGRRLEALRHNRGFKKRMSRHVGKGTRAFRVIQRVWIGTYRDGSIHAGNLAYMSILALFPFFITMAAIFAALGRGDETVVSVHAFLTAVPPMVANVIEPVARDVLTSRSGWLLWLGAVLGLWTVSSLIETIRDILHRAYGTAETYAFWRNRLLSTALIVGAVVLLLVSLFAQMMISGLQEAISAWFPRMEDWTAALATSRLLPALVLFMSIHVLFLSLTPSQFRGRAYPKWPGALVVTVWWVGVSTHLPALLRLFMDYSLTYGSLAGVMIALFFFWLVGLGIVVGAELNAALAQSPEERALLDPADTDGPAGQQQEDSE